MRVVDLRETKTRQVIDHDMGILRVQEQFGKPIENLRTIILSKPLPELQSTELICELIRKHPAAGDDFVIEIRNDNPWYSGQFGEYIHTNFRPLFVTEDDDVDQDFFMWWLKKTYNRLHGRKQSDGTWVFYEEDARP